MRRAMEYRNRNESRGRWPDRVFRGAVLAVLLLPLSLSAQAPVEACTKLERQNYFDAIEARIHENWRVPYANRPLSCKVLIKQDFRGEVRDVGIARCGEDPVVHRSVINAAYNASPLPLPGKKSCFSGTVIVTIESRAQKSD